MFENWFESQAKIDSVSGYILDKSSVEKVKIFVVKDLREQLFENAQMMEVVVNHGKRKKVSAGRIFCEDGVCYFTADDFSTIEKISNGDRILTVDLSNHSVFGYIFLENYTVYSTDMAEICLYHHIPYDKYSLISIRYKEIAMLFNILNDIDNIYINRLSLDMGKLLSHIDEEFTIEVCNIFSKINEDDILYKKISSGEYLSELYNYLDTIEISKEELEQFTKMIIQWNNFRSRGTLYNDLIRKYNEINNQYEELCRDKTES